MVMENNNNIDKNYVSESFSDQLEEEVIEDKETTTEELEKDIEEAKKLDLGK